MESKNIQLGLLVIFICFFSFGCEPKPKSTGIMSSEGIAVENESTISESKIQPVKIGRSDHKHWFSGGTLHKSKMREWSRATYDNKLATAADLVIGCLKVDGVNVMIIDIERELKPMAIDFARGLDNANEGGVADNQSVSEVAAMMWVLMKNTN